MSKRVKTISATVTAIINRKAIDTAMHAVIKAEGTQKDGHAAIREGWHAIGKAAKAIKAPQDRDVFVVRYAKHVHPGAGKAVLATRISEYKKVFGLQWACTGNAFGVIADTLHDVRPQYALAVSAIKLIAGRAGGKASISPAALRTITKKVFDPKRGAGSITDAQRIERIRTLVNALKMKGPKVSALRSAIAAFPKPVRKGKRKAGAK